MHQHLLTATVIFFFASILVLCFQPKGSIKWFLLIFSMVPLCVGTISLLVGLRHSIPHSDVQPKTAFVVCGVAWAFAALLFTLGVMAKSGPPRPERERACYRHARWILLASIVGFISAPFAWKALGHFQMYQSGREFLDLVVVAVLTVVPGLIIVYRFPPRCGSCGVGQMRMRGLRPVWYRCQQCGDEVHTSIQLGGNRRN